MLSKQVVASSKLLLPGALCPGGGQTLKSERVQLHAQLPERARRLVQAICGGLVTVGEEVVVSFELTLASGVEEDATADLVAAGPALGTPDHNVNASTLRKEADHAGC